MAAVASSAQGATYLSVGPDSLCSAGGCLSEARRSFTQSFSAGQGVTGISALALDRSILGDMQHHAVRVSFELADGTTVDWGKFTVAVLGGDVVTLGGQAFAWNSAMGDLKVRLDLILPEKGGAGGGGGGFGVPGGSFASLPAPAPGFLPGRSPVLGNQVLAAVPEPGAWALMIMGFGGAGAALRQRRRQAQTTA